MFEKPFPYRTFRPNTALIKAAEEAERNMYVFRRGLAIRAARRMAAAAALAQSAASGGDTLTLARSNSYE